MWNMELPPQTATSHTELSWEFPIDAEEEGMARALLLVVVTDICRE